VAEEEDEQPPKKRQTIFMSRLFHARIITVKKDTTDIVQEMFCCDDVSTYGKLKNRKNSAIISIGANTEYWQKIKRTFIPCKCEKITGEVINIVPH